MYIVPLKNIENIMALPHYSNSIASTQHYEPVYKALFEVTIFPPAAINFDQALLLQHVKSIGGLDGLNPAVTTTEQKFKQATRSYAGFPEKTTLDLAMVFTMNLNHSNENYIYTALRRWCNIIWNPLNGASGMKKDYVGSMIIVQFNRDGSIYRKIICKDAFPMGQLQVGDTLDYSDSEAAEAQLSFRCDYWDEQIVGI